MQNLSVQDQKTKKSLLVNRIFGIVLSLAILTLLLLYYFNVLDEWIISISTMMLSAMNFITCTTISQKTGRDNIISANLFLSILFFLMGLGIMIYGILTKNLILPF